MPNGSMGFAKFLAQSLGIFCGGLSLATESVWAQDAEQLLEYSLEELGQIRVITPSKRIQKQGEAPATIYVVTEEEIKQYGYRDLKDVLHNLPGIEYVNSHSSP